MMIKLYYNAREQPIPLRLEPILVPRNANSYMHEHPINISTSGTVGSNKILGKYAPLYSIGTMTLEGIGGGDSVNLGGTYLFKDEIISWVDGTTAYYTIEWEGRLNFHP